MSNLPIDFENKMKVLLGAEFDAFLEGYDNDKYQALRINPLKKAPVDIDAIFAELIRSSKNNEKDEQCTDSEQEWEAVPWEKNGYYYNRALRPGKHAYHEAGVYYIQEPSAMSAAALLAPKPGMKVLDLCAAPGGKSTQLAGYLMQEGLLVSNEINAARCKILSQNIERMGIQNAIVTNEDSAKLAEAFPSFFHAILVDAPCSGEGMFRKNPIALEEWSLDNVTLCANRQAEILDNAAKMLMGGGRMVYSTCTFSPEENEKTIAAFLDRHPEFSVEEVEAPSFSKGISAWAKEGASEAAANEMDKTFRLWPHKLHGEGHYVAVLKKAGEFVIAANSAIGENETKIVHKKDSKKKNVQSQLKGFDKQMEQSFYEFLDETVNKEVADWITSGNLTLFGDQLYRMPDSAPSIRGLRVLRAGLHIGEFKKNRFEPSHALALSLGIEDVSCAVNIKCVNESAQETLPTEDARISAFFRGESLYIEEQELCKSNTKQKGWTLLCVDGFSAGWGKLANGQLKNHYPKGLRREV